MIPLITWSAIGTAVGWWFLRKIGRLADQLIDPPIDRLAERLNKRIVAIPLAAKRWLLRGAGRLFRLSIQGIALYGMIYLALPIILANHLTLRQSVLLAESSLRERLSTYDNALAFLNQHGALLVSLPEPPRNALVLTDHQRLVGLGILEDGEIYVGEKELKFSPGKAQVLGYRNKLTPLGKRVTWWRFRWKRSSTNHANGETEPPSN